MVKYQKELSMNGSTKVSIVIVTLNTKFSFLKTVHSAIKQSYLNKEIIIVDGNSSDGTINEIKRLKKNFSKIVIDIDKGIYDAMNKGIALSTGNWILFLNSGDIFYNKKILYEIFNKNSIRKKDVIFGDTYVVNKNMQYLVKGQNFSPNTYIMPFCHQSTLVKSSILKKYNFSLNYTYSSDFDFFKKCFEKKKIFYYLNTPITIVEANGLSDTNRNDVYNENIRILNKYNSTYIVIQKLYILKLYNLIQNLCKIILPEYIKFFFLKLKYKKNLIKK